jgi:magnesium-transporting ATPase (P-type)
MAYWKGEIAQTDRPQPVRTHASLSSQGLSFTTDANFSRGDLLSLHLILPGTTLESLQCKAHVLSVGQETKKGRKTALKIVHIMPEDSEKFSLFILAEHFRSMQAKTRLMALMLGNW